MTTLADTVATVERAHFGYVETCADVTGTEWVARALARGWSVADTTEHVTTTNVAIHRLLSRGLRPRRRGEATALSDDDITVRMFEDAGPAPGPEPTGTWTDPADAIAQFEQSMRALVGAANPGEEALRAAVGDHPVFGLMDGVQWLRFAAVHTESHRIEVTQREP